MLKWLFVKFLSRPLGRSISSSTSTSGRARVRLSALRPGHVLALTSATALATSLYVTYQSVKQQHALQLLAKPKDTPQYLIPYYLTSVRTRFNHYASKANADGDKLMTVDDFLRSLLVSDKTQVFQSDRLKKLFKEIDSNHDGLLSYAEYALFMTCFSARRRDFEILFQMFDFDNSGSVNFREFTEVIHALSPDKILLPNSGGIIETLFGKTCNKQIHYKQFLHFLDRLRTEVAKVEFLQFDPKNTGFVSPESFSKLITSCMLGSHLPFYIVNNIRKLQSPEHHSKGVSYQAWETFMFLTSINYDLEKAIRLYTNCGYPLTKIDLIRAVKSVSGISLKQEAVDMVFALFDKDGDGNLEHDEFLAVLQSKRTFNSQERSISDQAQRNLVQSVFKCLQDAVAASHQQQRTCSKP